jgi:AraC-like DNA-binding protein
MESGFYEFMFNLRASGFSHNTPETAQKIQYELRQNKNFKFLTELDGQVGSLSEDALTNLRNLAVGLCFLSAKELIDLHCDPEYVHSISDYYINKVQSIYSLAKYEEFLIDMILHYHQLGYEKKQKSYGKTIDKCIHYIEQHLYGPLRVNDIAQYMQMTPSYITTLFKRRTGQRLYSYIQARKMEESKMMMDNTAVSISEIASALGYHSLSHFSKAFKASTGQSPRSYRND